MYIYFDESKYSKENFIFGSFVFCHENPDGFITKILETHGFNSDISEFKSSVHFGLNPKMLGVRDELKNYFHDNCHFGIVFLEHDELENLGFIALRALKQFLNENIISNNNQIFFDEGIFRTIVSATSFVREIGLEQNQFYFEQDSKQIKGIQLADLSSHCLTTMLRESLGDLNKQVKCGENSGYDPDTEFEIGFDVWASIRYSFLREPDKKHFESESIEANFTYNVEPFGLFISENCNNLLAEKVRETFGKVYLGCIH